MDLMDALLVLVDYYEPPMTPQDVVVEVWGELDHESVNGDVVDGEITDAKVALAFHTVIDASEAELADAIEEISCGVRS